MLTTGGPAAVIETASASTISDIGETLISDIIPGAATTTPEILPMATTTPDIAPASEPVIVSTTTPETATTTP